MVVAAALARGGLRRSGAMRAALLGTAAGLLFGLVSALTKGTVEILADEGLAVLGDWHVYALAALGFAGMTLTQMALQTGVLPPAVATTSLVNPATSVVLGDGEPGRVSDSVGDAADRSECVLPRTISESAVGYRLCGAISMRGSSGHRTKTA